MATSRAILCGLSLLCAAPIARADFQPIPELNHARLVRPPIVFPPVTLLQPIRMRPPIELERLYLVAGLAPPLYQQSPRAHPAPRNQHAWIWPATRLTLLLSTTTALSLAALDL